MAALTQTSPGWRLGKLSFHSLGVAGQMVLDSGSAVTAVSGDFVAKAGLKIDKDFKNIKDTTVVTADGGRLNPLGTVDLPVSVQLLLDVSDKDGEPLFVHWDRTFTLKNVWVLPLGAESPRDLYVAWNDWRFDPKSNDATSPLGSLAQLVMHGATIVDAPRVPAKKDEYIPVVVERRHAGDSVVLAQLDLNDDSDMRARILARVPDEQRDSPLAQRLVEVLLTHKKIFGPLNTAECTEIIDFELCGTPTPVSFTVPISRRAQGAAATEGLEEWIKGGVCHKVPWDTEAYGFAIVVPKAGGKFRVTINPTGINKVTRKIDPDGGYMPSSMINEAMKVGHVQYAATLDLSQAFVTMKLGPTAQRLSTFTTPLGKLRWTQGYFGWHSFPAAFQRIIMEKVVLPTMDDVPLSTLLAWIDDLVVGAKSQEAFLDALQTVVKNLLAIGARVNLDKCHFIVSRFDWCGVEVDIKTQQWRIAPDRVKALLDIPVPTDREALHHVLGVLRYYWWGVADHKAQRERLALLAEIDVPGTHLSRVWTERHTKAMRDALEAVASGDWALVYDPLLPVWLTTDASGNHGYCIVANQFDRHTGKLRPIAYYSTGWESTQLQWTPQVKECYAAKQAVTHVMPKAFPYATLILLGDNKNLASYAESKDLRVVRWQQDIRDTGATVRGWIKGELNTIADYGSRAVVANPTATLSEEQTFDLGIFAALTDETITTGTATEDAAPSRTQTFVEDSREVNTHTAAEAAATDTDYGHVRVTPIVQRILDEQAASSKEEKEGWSGPDYSTVNINGAHAVRYKNKLLVPSKATALKQLLLRMAHDDQAHYSGTDHTLENLIRGARVTWVGIDADVRQYIASCFKCTFAKAPHTKRKVGTLSPTAPPHVHHTWYIDLKGPMPWGTGYLMAVVEATTRFTKLRYLPANTAKEVCEEIHEAIVSFGTAPHIIRSDTGQPFDSSEYRKFISDWNITAALGVPYHSQGQGKVENKFRSIAAAIIATLGAKAAKTWFEGSLLSRLESIINSTVVSSIGGSPSWAMYGREPRTMLSAATDCWSWRDEFGTRVLQAANADENDYQNIIAEHHSAINAVQGRAQIASDLASAITKVKYDADRKPARFKTDDWVIVHNTAPNRMQPWFTGPYKITSVSPDGNFVTAAHFNQLEADTKQIHVSRLLPFDYSRATREEIVQFQLEAGSAVVDAVIEHRVLADGLIEFNIQWLGHALTSWLPSTSVRKIIKVIDYCKAHGLPAPGTEPRRAKSQAETRASRAKRGATS